MKDTPRNLLFIEYHVFQAKCERFECETSPSESFNNKEVSMRFVFTVYRHRLMYSPLQWPRHPHSRLGTATVPRCASRRP